MDELQLLTEALRRQRAELQKAFARTGSSSAETTRIVEKIAELRRRMETGAQRKDD